MEMDAAAQIEKWAITKLKKERQLDSKEFEYFKNTINELTKKYPGLDWDQLADFLYKVNGFIWDLEAAIREATIDDNIVEVGRRAILVRKFNSLRVEFKNIINKLANEGVQDKKTDHLSA